MVDEIDTRIPNTATVWQLWQSDTFDRDAPFALQATGKNIVLGLYKLWHYTLNEGILDDGNASFSRFQLTWGITPATRAGIFVNPFDNLALLKLRRWNRLMSEDQEREAMQNARTVEKQKDALLWRLAQLHFESLQKSIRWKTTTIDWNAEAREVLARVELTSDPEEL